VQLAEIRRSPWLALGEFEGRAEIRMVCEQIAALARRRREPVAPEGNVVDDRGKFRAHRKVRLDARAEDE